MKTALAPLAANWWAEARPMPRGEFAPVRWWRIGFQLGERNGDGHGEGKVGSEGYRPVMMMTLSLHLL